MCNLSDLIEERGIDKGIAIGEERGIAIGEERGIAIGEKRGERYEQFNTVVKLLAVMNSSEIVRVLNYEEAFVADIVSLLQSHPDATNEEIFNMLTNLSEN